MNTHSNLSILASLGLSLCVVFPFGSRAQVADIAAGDFHTLIRMSDDSLWAVGKGGFGQLGNDDNASRNAPVQIVGEVNSVAAGAYHSLFLKKDLTLWGMGKNISGQLGDGSNTNRSTPVQINQAVGPIDGIAAGYDHSLFIDNSILYSMGKNEYGQLGDGSTTNRSTPVLIDGNVSAVASGHGHSFYIKTDRSLWAMGRNFDGQLGDGSTTDRSTPVLIEGNVSSVAGGYDHSIYVKTDGSLWAMGRNFDGQLGDGTTVNKSTPVQIDGNVSSVAAGAYHSFYLKTNGSLWAMGNNDDGQLGDGSTTDRNTPLQIDGNVSSVAAGYSCSLYIKTDGSLWVMGENSDGQLGDGTNGNKVNPIEPKPFYLDLQALPGGTVLGGGNYGISTTATLYAVPQAGYFFNGWVGDFPPTGNPAIVTMDGAKTISANFTNLSSHTNALEEIARTEGNASGISYVQNNPSTYNLFTHSEKESAESAASAQSLATVQANLAQQGLSLLTYFDQVNANLPHTHNWYYQPGMGWLWTQPNTFPYVYLAASEEEAGGWLYFSQLADQPNPSFYDYASETWITPSASD